MRWEALFDDLEAQFAAVELSDRAATVGDLTRAERATVHLEARLRADRAELVAARRHLSGRSEGETFVSHHQPTKREIP